MRPEIGAACPGAFREVTSRKVEYGAVSALGHCQFATRGEPNEKAGPRSGSGLPFLVAIHGSRRAPERPMEWGLDGCLPDLNTQTVHKLRGVRRVVLPMPNAAAVRLRLMPCSYTSRRASRMRLIVVLPLKVLLLRVVEGQGCERLPDCDSGALSQANMTMSESVAFSRNRPVGFVRNGPVDLRRNPSVAFSRILHFSGQVLSDGPTAIFIKAWKLST